ncbi:MBL fold metallo-hydrolase [Nannocystis radixulma]|uniref:MBL fold metallo-hydrolase n=1 Tax=Nannocystis radixulma TaxID=2995305 RepID=A0ABT5AZR6_9BACT|nr:MBL fold metallo-hydrolase [Nannocystis radixulma]MDC0666993.1 MBL fold metallo-hydrolase [Nannocystis radixulma]
MRVHHIDCLGSRPFVLSGRLGRGEIVSHCLIVETARELVLVDTGVSSGIMSEPRAGFGLANLWLAQPRIEPEDTAVRQLVRLGYDPDDVRHVILTHLDFDHAGGIADFPRAQVHVYGPELRAALSPSSRFERFRYDRSLWAHGPSWQVHELDGGERWFGFEAVRQLGGLGPEILLVPLTGHTRGHVGVAIDTGGSWLLHAGDAYYVREQLQPTGRGSQLALALLDRTPLERPSYRHNQQRLRELVATQGDAVSVFSSHDRHEFDAWRAGGE